MDNLSPGNRKKTMSRIRSTGNRSTERLLRSSLVGAGISGFQMHAKFLPGTPDFVFSREKLAIFVDGCFWHGCPKCYVRPKSSQGYWDDKLERNRARDARADRELSVAGWYPLRIWEHSLKRPEVARQMVLDVLINLRKNHMAEEINAPDSR